MSQPQWVLRLLLASQQWRRAQESGTDGRAPWERAVHGPLGAISEVARRKELAQARWEEELSGLSLAAIARLDDRGSALALLALARGGAHALALDALALIPACEPLAPGEGGADTVGLIGALAMPGFADEGMWDGELLSAWIDKFWGASGISGAQRAAMLRELGFAFRDREPGSLAPTRCAQALNRAGVDPLATLPGWEFPIAALALEWVSAGALAAFMARARERMHAAPLGARQGWGEWLWAKSLDRALLSRDRTMKEGPLEPGALRDELWALLAELRRCGAFEREDTKAWLRGAPLWSASWHPECAWLRGFTLAWLDRETLAGALHMPQELPSSSDCRDRL